MSPQVGGDVGMMGERTVAQEALFYSFNLERHVPADHLLRSIDRFVDLSCCATIRMRERDNQDENPVWGERRRA